jgi:hypothetical protein
MLMGHRVASRGSTVRDREEPPEVIARKLAEVIARKLAEVIA